MTFLFQIKTTQKPVKDRYDDKDYAVMDNIVQQVAAKYNVYLSTTEGGGSIGKFLNGGGMGYFALKMPTALANKIGTEIAKKINKGLAALDVENRLKFDGSRILTGKDRHDGYYIPNDVRDMDISKEFEYTYFSWSNVKVGFK